MAAELITPVDELTGIPLPILPQEVLNHSSPHTNWHHPWHANSAPELQGLGGRALRHSRVQLVRATDHNYKDKTGRPNYHNFYIGPELPTDTRKQFELCVLSAAGYMPDMAIDLRSGEPVVVPMSDVELTLLRTPAKTKPITTADKIRLRRQIAQDYAPQEQLGSKRQLYKQALNNMRDQQAKQASFGFHHMVYQYQPMRDFFQQLVVEQEVVGINETQVEEFLLTKNIQTKQKIGQQLLELAVNQTADQIEEPYQVLRRAGKFHPKMPTAASKLVYYKLGTHEERDKLAATRAQRLGARLGIA